MNKLYVNTLEAAKRTNVSDRVLQRWVAWNVIQPAIPSTGSGFRHQWSAENLFILKILGLLRGQIDDTIILTKVRKAIQARRPTDEILIISQHDPMCISWKQLAETWLWGKHVHTIVRLDNQ